MSEQTQTGHDKRMALHAQIDAALKALGQDELLKRVEELECIIAECYEQLKPLEDCVGITTLLNRCKEALK